MNDRENIYKIWFSMIKIREDKKINLLNIYEDEKEIYKDKNRIKEGDRKSTRLNSSH